MTRSELISRLKVARRHAGDVTWKRLDDLIKDIEADGVLDVQAPSDIAKSMSLPTK